MISQKFENIERKRTYPRGNEELKAYSEESKTLEYEFQKELKEEYLNPNLWNLENELFTAVKADHSVTNSYSKIEKAYKKYATILEKAFIQGKNTQQPNQL